MPGKSGGGPDGSSPVFSLRVHVLTGSSRLLSTNSFASLQETIEAIAINALTYAYPGHQPIISDFTLHLPPGSRCLLIGANGAGKSTLLQILAGKHLVGEGAVRVLGRSAFHDIVSLQAAQSPISRGLRTLLRKEQRSDLFILQALTAEGELSYLGPQWRRTIAFAGTDVPLQAGSDCCGFLSANYVAPIRTWAY